MRRRRALAVLGAAALAGCGGRSGLDLGPLLDDADRTATADGDPDRPRTTAPALPYRGPEGQNVATPRGISVENDSGRRRYVTVAVTSRTGRDLLVESGEVADESTLRFPRVVARRGTYDVVVETADGERLRRAWRVSDALGDFEARVDRGLSALQTATCSPGCPLSTGGERTTPDDDGPRGTFYLVNRRSRRVAVALELSSAYRTGLRYGYEVPPGVRVAVPAIGWGEPEYRATVAVGGSTASERWSRADGQRMYAVVGDDGTRFLCDTRYRDLRVRNETARPRTVGVTVLGDGEPTFRQTVDVAAESVVRRANAVAPANQFAFDLWTADGEREHTEWGICPSRGSIDVVVSDRGLWVGVRSMR